MIENNQVVSIEYEVKENGTDSVLDSNMVVSHWNLLWVQEKLSRD